jgi:hypothetical protein
MRLSIPAAAGASLYLLAATAVANWSSCGGDLRSVQSYARDAEAVARNLDRIEQAVDSAKREYDLCASAPQVPDRSAEDCASLQLAYAAKLSELNSAKSRIDAQINALLRGVTAAINNCR